VISKFADVQIWWFGGSMGWWYGGSMGFNRCSAPQSQ